VHKLTLLFAFVAAVVLGAACASPEVEACENFKKARDACEAMNGSEAEAVNFDLCDNVDSECKEFYECAATQACTEFGGVFRLDYGKTCTQPEDKECTDADLRP